MNDEQLEKLQRCVKEAMAEELGFLNTGALNLITMNVLKKLEEACKDENTG